MRYAFAVPLLCVLSCGCAGVKGEVRSVADLPSPAETIAAWRPAKPAIFVKPRPPHLNLSPATAKDEH